MLKIICIITALTLPRFIYANEFEVEIHDIILDEVVIEKISNLNELKSVTEYLLNLNDDSIKFKIREINTSRLDAIVRGGGEGGGD